jgi:hypothetical protein
MRRNESIDDSELKDQLFAIKKSEEQPKRNATQSSQVHESFFMNDSGSDYGSSTFDEV